MAFNDSLIGKMTVALPLAGALLTPDEAEACSPDPCAFIDRWTEIEPVNAAAIPIDGVLLLRGENLSDGSEEDALAKLDLTVTRDGQPIAGALETSAIDNVLVWRPEAPLDPSATYKVTGTLTNEDLDEYYDWCGPELLMLDFEFQTDAGPAAPLAAPEPGIQEMTQITPFMELEDMVCCDGAMPYMTYWDCGSDDEYAVWDAGYCTSRRGFGRLRVQVTAEVAAPAATAGVVMRELLIDGESSRRGLEDSFSISDSKPFCTSVRLTNLGTGESVLSKETCHGADVVDQLGELVLDPSGELGANCSSGAYVCELDPTQMAWDKDRCEPWPGEEATTGDPTGGPTSEDPTSGGPTSEGPGTGSGTDSNTDSSPGGPDSGGQDDLVDHGCACDGGGANSLGILGLIGLGLLRPRRRARGGSRRSA